MNATLGFQICNTCLGICSVDVVSDNGQHAVLIIEPKCEQRTEQQISDMSSDDDTDVNSDSECTPQSPDTFPDSVVYEETSDAEPCNASSSSTRVLRQRSACFQATSLAASNSQNSVNTQRVTSTHIRQLGDFLRKKGEQRLPEVIPPTELDAHLASFFMNAKKIDPKKGTNSEYEPSSLSSMFSSFNRHLTSLKYEADIKWDQQFSGCRSALCVKLKQLKRLGKGAKKHHISVLAPFAPAELQALLDEKLLGIGEPCLKMFWPV